MPPPRKTYRYRNLEKLEWLTPDQTAQYLGYRNVDTIRRQANAGLYKRYGTGKGQKFNRRELDSYLEQHKPWQLPKSHKLSL